MKAKLFEPYQRKVSVFLTKEWSAQQRVQCGLYVASDRTHKLYGWVILQASKVPKMLPDPPDPLDTSKKVCPLMVEVNNNPPGHADIVGWPGDMDEMLAWQGALADLSSGFRFPSPIEI